MKNLTNTDIRYKYNELWEEHKQLEQTKLVELQKLQAKLEAKDADIEEFYNDVRQSRVKIEDQAEQIERFKSSIGTNNPLELAPLYSHDDISAVRQVCETFSSRFSTLETT